MIVGHDNFFAFLSDFKLKLELKIPFSQGDLGLEIQPARRCCLHCLFAISIPRELFEDSHWHSWPPSPPVIPKRRP